MEDPSITRAMAEHIFTRIVLSDLMVEACMRADDPVADAEERARIKLAALDANLDIRADRLSHLVLAEFESFWTGVRTEVEARTRSPD